MREARGWTLEELAEKAGTTHPTIQRLEAGRRQLSERWIRILARIFDVHPGEILEPLPGVANADLLSAEQRRAIEAFAATLTRAAS